MDGMMAGVTAAMDMTNSTMNHDHHMMNSTMHHHEMGNSTMHDHDMGNSTMHNHDDMDHGDSGHSMMHMYFYLGVTNVTVLFQSWVITNGGEMAGACIGVFLLAALYEGLKVLREVLLQRSTMKTRARQNGVTYSTGQLVDSATITTKPGSTICSWSHLLQSCLHLVQVTISYSLMLIFMTYNGYLAIAILLGACVGYFAFGWRKAVIVDVNEHCH